MSGKLDKSDGIDCFWKATCKLLCGLKSSQRAGLSQPWQWVFASLGKYKVAARVRVFAPSVKKLGGIGILWVVPNTLASGSEVSCNPFSEIVREELGRSSNSLAVTETSSQL